MARASVADNVRAARTGLRRAVGHGRLMAAAKGFRPPLDEQTADPEDVRLVRAGAADRTVLANLVQLYRHDLSELRGYELGEDGTYAYPYLDANLTDPDRETYLLKVEDRLAGFVMIRRLPDGVRQISELFVARTQRRRGVARIALRKTVELYSGTWTCFVDQLNETSLRVCANVATEAGGRDPQARPGISRNGFVGTVLRFVVPERVTVGAPEAGSGPAEGDRPE